MKRDSQIFDLIGAERKRQTEGIELIASENYVSDQVMEAMGSVLTNKYAEGYPGARYYGGCEVVDRVETLAIERVCRLYGAEYANVQPHSGAQANMAVFFAVLKPGDTFMGLDLAHGGHLSHGSAVNMSGMYFNAVGYQLNEQTGTIDYEDMERKALEHRPKLIIGGASAYSREWDYKRMREIADKVGALLLIDMAHTAGLIAAGLLDNPVKYAHIVTSTTHKTLRGPRGGIILMGKDFDNPWGYTTPKGVVKKMSQLLNSAVFPGIQGGPLEHVIAAKAVAFGEALAPEYKEYQAQVQKNAKAMAEAFVKRGYKIVSGGTDNHLMLVDLRTKFPELTGKLAERCLVAADITTNKNMVPFDSRSPFQTSGLRFGTPAITTRGLKEDKMELIVELIDRVLHDPENEANIAAGKLSPETFPQLLPQTVLMAVEDLYDATSFVAGKSAEWGIDPARIVACGSSAGAITVLQGAYFIANENPLTAKLPDGFDYAGVISFAGAVVDMADDLTWKRAPAPIMLFHGDADSNVPYGALRMGGAGIFGSDYIARQLSDMKSPYYFYSVEGADHALATVPMNNYRDAIDQFLTQQVGERLPAMIDTKERFTNASPGGKTFTAEDYIRSNFAGE